MDNAILIKPIQRGNQYMLEMASNAGAIRFACQAERGGLITGFSFDGTDVIADSAVGEIHGSTFWTSPQSDWEWPPPTAIDADAFAVEVDESSGTITLTSEPDPGLNVQVVKRFSPNLEKMAIDLEYVIHNVGTETRTLAPWEITRVTTGGLTFFPTGKAVYPTNMLALPTTEAAGVTWFEHIEKKVPKGDFKLYADGARGWLAHVKENLVFIKQFKDEPPERRAPNQGEIEIYVKGSGYEEVENQGAYQAIPPGDELSWQVRWYIRPVPENAAAEVGNQPLIDFIESVIE